MGFSIILYIKSVILIHMEEATDLQRKPVTGLKNVKYAGLFARFVAFIVDLAMAAFVMMGIMVFTQNVIMVNTPVVKNARANYLSYNINSGLFNYKEEGSEVLVPLESDNYKDYENLIVNYFEVFLGSENVPEKDRVNYDNYWFNVHLLGQEDVKHFYSSDDLNKIPTFIKENGSRLYTYRLEGENKLLDELALPKCLNNDPNGSVNEEQNAELKKYFYIPDNQNSDNQMHLYYIAVSDLNGRSYVKKAYATWSNAFYTYPLIGSFSLAMLIFFFIIPICLKNGETLGKLFFHLGLCNKIGYKYKKPQLILRFFFMLTIVVALLLIIGINLWSLGILTFLALASYGTAIFTKDHRALHDFIAGTIVYDKKSSTIFNDAKDEEAFDKAVSEYDAKFVDDTPGIAEANIIYKNDKKG